VTEHTEIIDRLAVRRDLSPEERTALQRHLAHCADCRRVAAAYDRQDDLLHPLGRVPAPPLLRSTVRQNLPRRATGDHRVRRWMVGALGVVAAVLVMSAAVLVVGSPHAAIPARASVLTTLRQLVAHPRPPLPYSGTAVVSYDEAVYGADMPVGSRAYSFPHRLLVRWSIRTVRQYRIDLTTQLPTIQAGTVTYIRNGERLLIYDHRSEQAAVEDLSAEEHDEMIQGTVPESPATFQLAILLNGGSLAGPYLDPTQSVRQNVASLGSSPGQPPLHPPAFVHVVGQTRLLGQPVDIVDIGPLERSDFITGCSFQRPGHCRRHPTGRGVERLWIATQRPVVLEYAERDTGSADLRTGLLVSRRQMRVTAVRFGAGPTARDLQLRPPVPLDHAGRGGNGGFATTVGSPLPASLPSPFFLPAPTTRGGPNTPTAYYLYDGPTGRVAEYDQVWSSELLEADNRQVGPYLVVQEYVQVHGLPAELKRGAARRAGGCAVYTGTYANGQRWIALQHGKVAVVASTNSLSSGELVRYAGQTLCGRVRS